MTILRLSRVILPLVLSGVSVGQVGAPAGPAIACPNFSTVDQFVDCQVVAYFDKEQVGKNGKGNDRQREAPSADSRSTSLVDQSSSTDFISIASSLIPVAAGISSSNTTTTSSTSPAGTGSGVATASLYALMSAFSKTSPTDPEFYRAHVNARRLSLTIGTAASTQATDNTTKPAYVYGVKILLINSRELYKEGNLQALRAVQEKLSAETAATADLTQKVEQIMCTALIPACHADHGLETVSISKPGSGYKRGDVLNVSGLPSGTGGAITVLAVDANGGISAAAVSSTGNKYVEGNGRQAVGGSGTNAEVNINGLASIDLQVFTSFINTHLNPENVTSTVKVLPIDATKRIADLVANSIEPFSSLRSTLNNTYDRIGRGMQMSVSSTANTRSANGNNNYRSELILDYGPTTSINWTVNGSFDYTDRKMLADSKGGRLATSIQGNLTNPKGAWSKDPLTLAFSGEGDWLSSQKPQYSFDMKLTIPVSPGFALPIEYRYANRTAQLNQTDSQVRLGLTVDISRIAQALK